MEADMKQIGNGDSSVVATPPRKSMMQTQSAQVLPEPTEKEKAEIIQKTVPELQEELFQLKRDCIPRIQEQINDVQQDLALIASVLRKRSSSSNGATDANYSSVAPVGERIAPMQHPTSSTSAARGEITDERNHIRAKPTEGGPWTAA